MNTSEQEQKIISEDSVQQQTDSLLLKVVAEPSVKSDSGIILKKKPRLQSWDLKTTDTISVCKRNPINDVTFYDSANFILNPSQDALKSFPFLFYENRSKTERSNREKYFRSLKQGEYIILKTPHEDWLIIIIVLSAFLYALIRSIFRKGTSSISRFFLFRGIGDSVSKDTGSLFHFDSTILNLVSFSNIALFIYCAGLYFDFIPAGISGFLVWLIALGAVIVAVTFRHVICLFTGNASKEKEVFSEYIITIYQSYRYSAFCFLILVVLLSYTTLFPANILLYSGILAFTILYLIRLLRLILIFMKRNVSIIYLILYLCALEFLPVVVLIKFLTGLF